MSTRPCKLHALRVSFSRTLKEGWMLHQVIDLIDILREPCGKSFQGPDREPFGVHLSREEARHTTGLGIAP